MSPSVVRVLHVLPDLDIGGGQVILKQSLEAAPAGASHLVVALGGGPMFEQFEAAGIRCRVIPVDAATDWPAALRKLTTLAREERIDVISSLNTPIDRSFCQVVGARLGLPVVIWFMSMAVPRLPFPPERGRELAFAKREVLHPLNALTSRQATQFVALSEAVAGSFADLLHAPPSAFEIIPPGLPADVLDRSLDDTSAAALRSELGITNDDLVCICVGMLIEHKGQQELIPAIARLRESVPNLRLLLVGEGPNRPALEQLITEHGLSDRVELLGHRTDVPDLLAVSDIFVSASRAEGFGLAVLEAMAAGLPVVAVDTPAFREFLEPGVSAVLVDRQEADLLAEALGDVCEDAERRHEMGRAGRRGAERRSAEVTGARLTDLYQRLVVRSPTSVSLPARVGGRVKTTVARKRGYPEVTVLGGPAAGIRLTERNASAPYTSGTNELPVQRAIVSELGVGDVFYDIGANIGFFSLLAAREVGVSGMVHAFEPVPENAACLADNAERNIHELASIEVHTLAVGGTSGRAELKLARHPGGAALDSADVPPDVCGSMTVELVTLDELVLERGLEVPDLIKIDVEGAELEVVHGMRSVLAAGGPTLIIEFDGPDAADVAQKRRLVADALEPFGYALADLDDAYPDQQWKVQHVLATRR